MSHSDSELRVAAWAVANMLDSKPLGLDEGDLALVARLRLALGADRDPYGALVIAARAVAEYRDPDARLIHVPGDVLDALIAALDALPLSREADGPK